MPGLTKQKQQEIVRHIEANGCTLTIIFKDEIRLDSTYCNIL
jgi:hypothetical protein